MLVLARKLHQKILIGDEIVIQVLRKNRDVVKLGIVAPESVPVHREEVYDEIQRNNQAALGKGDQGLPHFSRKHHPDASPGGKDCPPGPAQPPATTKPEPPLRSVPA